MLLLSAMLLVQLTWPVIGAAADEAAWAWSLRSPMLVAKDDFAVGVVNGRIYSFGGMTGARGTVLDDAEVYDPRSDEWLPLPPLPVARRSVRAEVVGPVIYVVGGVASSGATAAVEAFDTRSSAWFRRAAMPTPRYGIGLVSVGDDLFAIGGFRDGQALSTVEHYDPVTDQWQPRAPMPTPRTHPAVAVVDGLVYVLGGEADQGALAIVEIYDPENDRWLPGPSLPVPMSNVSAAVLDGRIHVLQHHDHVVYDVASETWSSAEPMPTPRHGLGLAVVEGVLYAFGGCHEQLFDLNVVEAYRGEDVLGSDTAGDSRAQDDPWRRRVTVGGIRAAGWLGTLRSNPE